MSGVAIIGEILRSYGPLTSLVPIALIREDELDEKSSSGIVISAVSTVDRNTIAKGATRMVWERVDVTVLATNVRDRTAWLKLVRRACAHQVGEFAGLTGVSVVLDGSGPPMRMSDPAMYLRTQSFGVSFNEPTA